MYSYRQLKTFQKSILTLRASKFLSFDDRMKLREASDEISTLLDKCDAAIGRAKEVYNELKPLQENDSKSIKKLLEERDAAIDEVLNGMHQINGIKPIDHDIDKYKGNTQSDITYRQCICELEGIFLNVVAQ